MTHSDGTLSSEEEVIIAPQPASAETQTVSAVEVEDSLPSQPDATAQSNFDMQANASASVPTPNDTAPMAEGDIQADPAGTEVVDASEDATLPGSAILESPGIAPATFEIGTAASQPTAETNAEGPAPSEPVQTASAPAVFLSTAAGVDVLQSPGDSAVLPDVTSVVIDAITYSESGDVVLNGRGTGTDSVRIYLDNAPITSSRIAADGRWRATLPNIDSGTYTLRVDQLGNDGRVASRVETPFLREEASVLAAAAALSTYAPVKAITVQPGNTLWAIARSRYGEGTAYVRVFEANRTQIRDPDLIYPGQVFTIPQE
jgi:nucleoid-associated protein YgaU